MNFRVVLLTEGWILKPYQTSSNACIWSSSLWLKKTTQLIKIQVLVLRIHYTASSSTRAEGAQDDLLVGGPGLFMRWG